MTSYSPDLNNTEVSPEQTGQVAEHEITRSLAGPVSQAAASGADPAGPGNPAAALHTVSAGVRMGIPPLQFMDSIDAGGRQMGNRAYMHWVEQLHAGPVQVNAASVSAATPVQMRKRKNGRADTPRPGNAPRQDLPAAEEEAVEMADLAEGQGVPTPAGSGMDLLPFEEHPDPGQFVENPVYQPPGGDEAELQQGLAGLDQAVREMLDLAGEPVQQQAAAGNVINGQPGEGERGYLATIANYLFAGAQPAGDDDARGTRERYFTYFFPAVTYLYSCLKDRAGQVQTDEHGACSLRGILNMLATVMFGVMMVAPGLPLDVINNVLGGIARVIVMLSTILGLPADRLLKLYQKKYPPEEEDVARVSAEDALIYLPRHIPEWLISLGFSGYFQAAISQGSISPSEWIQPWTPARIAVIVARMIADLVLLTILFGGLAKWVGKNVLYEKLGWGPTRSTVYLLSLPAIISPVIDYISSYMLNPELSIYLVYQNILDENDYAPGGSAATTHFIGYAALGLFLQYLAGLLLMLFLLLRISGGNEKWRKQFYALSNRLLRYIAVFLASARNMIINVLSLSNFAALVATNIIGPLAREFGQGEACLWPLAAADVCGGLPDDFNLTEFVATIEDGKSGLPPEHIDIIRAFPGLVGILGLGIPIGAVIALLCRKRWAGRGAAEPDRGGRGAGRRGRARRTRRGTPVTARRGRRAAGRDRARLAEEDIEAGRRADGDEGEASPHMYDTISSTREPGQTATAVVGVRHSPAPPVTVQADEEPETASLTWEETTADHRDGDIPGAEQLDLAESNIPRKMSGSTRFVCWQVIHIVPPSRFTPDYVQKIIQLNVDRGNITEAEARLTKDWVRRYLFPHAPEPRRSSDTASGSASSSYIHMSGTAQATQGSPETPSESSGTSYYSAFSQNPEPGASATSLHAVAQAVYAELLSQAGQLTVEEMERRLREEIEKRRLTEEEAADVRRWLEDVMLFPRQS